MLVHVYPLGMAKGSVPQCGAIVVADDDDDDNELCRCLFADWLPFLLSHEDEDDFLSSSDEPLGK